MLMLILAKRRRTAGILFAVMDGFVLSLKAEAGAFCHL